MSELQDRYHAVLETMAQAAKRAGRPSTEITLVAVTKTWPVAVVQAAYAAGMRQFGENRPEELAAKRPQLPDDIVWHQIGVLQSRKTGLVADHADLFHALDRVKIAQKLSRRLVENGRTLPFFLEVNVSGEASKSGLFCTRWETDATQQAELRTVVETVNTLPGLQLCGLRIFLS